MGGAGRGGGGGGEKDRAEYNESQELENLQRVFQILSNQKPGSGLSDKDQPKVSPDKLAEALKKLQYKCKRTDVEDMIWEVDEDCDGLISWDEFKAMFYRVRHDKTGWEPRRLFNVVEFMMHDKARARPSSGGRATTRRLRVTRHFLPSPALTCPRLLSLLPTHTQDQSASIDMDECMEILFRRFGKEQLEARVNEFMANDEVRGRGFGGGPSARPLTCLPGTSITSPPLHVGARRTETRTFPSPSSSRWTRRTTSPARRSTRASVCRPGCSRPRRRRTSDCCGRWACSPNEGRARAVGRSASGRRGSRSSMPRTPRPSLYSGASAAQQRAH